MIRKLSRTVALITVGAMLATCGPAADSGAAINPSPGTNGATSSSPAALPNTATASPGAATPTNAELIHAVATTSIIADLVQNIGGDRINVRSLLPPGADPHTYSPAPSDVQALANAQILVKNGQGLDEWLDEVIANAGGERPVVTATEGITPMAGDQQAAEDTNDGATAAAGNEDDHDGAHEADPHMWFDVQLAIRYVENIRDGLIQVDPAGAHIYGANAEAYIEQLEQLDKEIAEQLEAIPQENRTIVTNHDTFGYFAQRYGFEVVGTVFRGVSTEQEPSAQQIATLVRAIEEQHVPAIFTENTVNPRLAEQIADEAGVQVVTDLYTDALSEPGGDADTYVTMMRHNVEQIVEALQ